MEEIVISNYEQLKFVYSILNFVKDAEALKKFKRGIRNFYRLEDIRIENENPEKEGRWTYHSDTKRVQKIIFDDIFAESPEEIREIVWEDVSADKLKEWYTVDVKVFAIEKIGKTIVYIIQNRDI